MKTLTNRFIKALLIAFVISLSFNMAGVAHAADIVYEVQNPKACKATAVSNALRYITKDNTFYASNLYANGSNYSFDGSKVNITIRNHHFENVVELGRNCTDNESGTTAKSQKEAIDNSLSIGIPIVVQVDGNPWHWITVISKKGEEYQYIDPTDASIKTRSTFGASGKWYGYVSFKIITPTIKGSFCSIPKGAVCLKNGERISPYSPGKTGTLTGTSIIRLGPYDTYGKVVTPKQGTVVTVTSKLINNKGNVWYSVNFEYGGKRYIDCWVYSGNINLKT